MNLSFRDITFNSVLKQVKNEEFNTGVNGSKHWTCQNRRHLLLWETSGIPMLGKTSANGEQQPRFSHTFHYHLVKKGWGWLNSSPGSSGVGLPFETVNGIQGMFRGYFFGDSNKHCEGVEVYTLGTSTPSCTFGVSSKINWRHACTVQSKASIWLELQKSCGNISVKVLRKSPGTISEMCSWSCCRRWNTKYLS